MYSGFHWWSSHPSENWLRESVVGRKWCAEKLHIDRESAVMRDSVISSSPCLLMWTLSAQQQTFGQQFLWSHMSLDWQRHAGETFCSIGMYTSQRSTHQAEYRIQNKVKSTVTDNGSNFVKAFREFGVREDESDYCSDEVRFSDVLQEDGDGEQFFHPQHQLCAAHSLNLFATNGIHKVASNGPLRKLYRSAMAKSSSICNKTHRSSLATEVIQEMAICIGLSQDGIQSSGLSQNLQGSQKTSWGRSVINLMCQGFIHKCLHS